MAFQDFSIKKGIWGSTWVGFDQFVRFFNSPHCGSLIINTLLISFYGLIFSFPFPIIFALCLNEVRNKQFKKVTQTISYLPYFISVVVVVSILNDFCKANGVLTKLAEAFGHQGGALISSPEWFRTLYIGSNMWQHLGYNSIIFISALAAIDPELYEAARIDGAGRLSQTRYVTLPMLAPTIVLMLVLALGGVMNAGFDQIYNLYAPVVYKTGDIIDTYVYRLGITQAQYSVGTAVGLFKSAISLVLVVSSYKLADKLANYRIF